MRTRIKHRTVSLLLGVWFLATAAQGTAETNGIAWFTNYTADAFRELKAAREEIQPEQINHDLIDAAVFHETNRRRKEHAFPALAYDTKAREAAAIQSRAMAKHGFVGHGNPFNSELRTAMQRAQKAGLEPQVLAENVASAFARNYDGGELFYVRIEDGQQIFSKEPGGPPIRMRTYIEFADALLDDWMSSPGHRKNILDNAVEYLGAACAVAVQDDGMERVYCTQVFFTPLR